MTTTSTALALQRTVADNAALRMLRADHVAVIAGLLSTHLGRAGTRVATDDLYEVMDADLELLRDHFDLPKTARATATTGVGPATSCDVPRSAPGARPWSFPPTPSRHCACSSSWTNPGPR